MTNLYNKVKGQIKKATTKGPKKPAPIADMRRTGTLPKVTGPKLPKRKK